MITTDHEPGNVVADVGAVVVAGLRRSAGLALAVVEFPVFQGRRERYVKPSIAHHFTVLSSLVTVFFFVIFYSGVSRSPTEKDPRQYCDIIARYNFKKISDHLLIKFYNRLKTNGKRTIIFFCFFLLT